MSQAPEAALSAEQIAVNEASRAAEAESLYFLQAHRDYSGEAADNQRLADYLRQHGLDWTKENLEIAYDAIGDQLKHRTGQEMKDRAKKLTEQLNQPPTPAYPWPTPLSRNIINSMQPSVFKTFMKNPEFVRQVNATLKEKI